MRQLVLFIACLWSISLYGQDNSIKFRNLSIENGLSQSSVNCILQDPYGFIWIGTQDGLNMYDGREFTKHIHLPNDPQSISNNFITCLLLDKENRIWVGTQGGLNVMDPIKQVFKHFNYNARNEKSISSNDISCIAEDTEGNIWVGTKSRGLNKINSENNESTRYTTRNSGLSDNSITDIYVDEDGRIWASTLKGLNVFDQEGHVISYIRYSNTLNTLGNEAINCIHADSSGILWLGTQDGITKLQMIDDKPYFTQFSIQDTTLKESVNITSIYIDKKGVVWIGTKGQGLYKYFEDQTGASKFYRNRNIHYLPSSLISDDVYCIFPDKTGCVWIGTKNGISRFDVMKQGFVHLKQNYDSNNSLPSNTIWSIFPETNDLFWIGTNKGLSRYDRVYNSFTNYLFSANNVDRKGDKDVFFFFKDSKGQYWISTADGLYICSFSNKYKSVDIKPVEYKNERLKESNPIVYYIKEDRRGCYWIGTSDGLVLFKQESGDIKYFRPIVGNDRSIAGLKVRQILLGIGNVKWAATDNGLSKIIEKGDSVYFENYQFSASNSKSLSNNLVTSLWQDKANELWVGTYGGGVNKMIIDKHSFIHYTTEEGLANNAVYGVLGDQDNNLWISTNNGLSKFNRTNNRFTNYDKKDGLQSNEFNTGAYAKTSTSELIFGGINGINFFRPRDISINTIPPKVAIIGLNLGGTIVGAGDIRNNSTYTVSYKNASVIIDFAALHYTNPENNTFKYMLEGVDKDYTITSSEHRAHYTNLSPGKYTFKVYAANSDGVWTETPDKIEIIVQPPYWKTTWFQVLMIAVVLALAYGIYWMRVRDIRRQKIRLTNLVEQKTMKVIEQKNEIEKQKELLQLEKDKAEQLLLNILPEETAQELKSKGKASARHYRRVSVMFTDFKNFTRIAEDLKPQELVARLDSYFTEFDKIVESHNLEKIKTIGDAYMCAGGVPVRDKENPIHTVLAALEIQRYMHSLTNLNPERKEDDHWELRIGINTGETIAGVIGSKRFAYDIWGNSVNVAARLEASCEPGKVNVSGATYNYIEPYFDCTYRGKIPAKNKGDIDMYYVNRIKPELSIDGRGEEPNQQFWDYVHLHLFSSINYMKAERYIMRLLEKKLSPKLHYHSIDHTRDVTEAAERIALLEGIKGEDLFLLQTAATYHDAGFVEQYDANEPVGAAMAERILPKYGYTEDQIKIISDLIHATKIPHQPKNHLEEIICDADLDYLGREDFHEIADKLRRELREHGKINSDRLWDEIQIKFLTQHKYFTKSAIDTRQPSKEKHLKDIRKRLEEDNYKD